MTNKFTKNVKDTKITTVAQIISNKLTGNYKFKSKMSKLIQDRYIKSYLLS